MITQARAEEHHEHGPQVTRVDAVAEQHDDHLGEQAGDRHRGDGAGAHGGRMAEILQVDDAVREEQRESAAAA